MSAFLAITCPHCGEDFEVSFDPSEGDAEFIIDCEVCCRPMTVRVAADGGTPGWPALKSKSEHERQTARQNSHFTGSVHS
jgi:ribosomal protein S27E